MVQKQISFDLRKENLECDFTDHLVLKELNNVKLIAYYVRCLVLKPAVLSVSTPVADFHLQRFAPVDVVKHRIRRVHAPLNFK